MLKQTSFTVLLFALFPYSVGAEQPRRPFPDSLFGIKLGSVHTLGHSGKHSDVGTLPIKEFKGANQFLGDGLHYYFKPLKDYPGFKYIENPKKPGDSYFATSFRLYLLPVIPQNASSPNDLKPDLLKWEVTLIEWSEDVGEKQDKEKQSAYFWASNFCKSLQLDIRIFVQARSTVRSPSCQLIFFGRHFVSTNSG